MSKFDRFVLYPPVEKLTGPPTWEDIQRLALHYPAVHDAVTLVERGDLTREQALILTVYALADAFQKLFSAEIKRRRIEFTPPIVPREATP